MAKFRFYEQMYLEPIGPGGGAGQDFSPSYWSEQTPRREYILRDSEEKHNSRINIFRRIDGLLKKIGVKF